MEDNSDIAFLAALADKEMRKSLQGSQGIQYQRTDWRKFLHPNQQIPPHLQQQAYPQQYHPQQQYPVVQPQQSQEPFIPEGTLPPSNQQLLQLPPGYQQPVNPQQISSTESYQNFQVPNYNEPPKTYLEDEKEFRDALIKEIKSLKNTIKDLKKQVFTLTVSVNPILDSLKPTIKSDNANINQS